MSGFIVQQRTFLAGLAEQFPAATRTLIGARWVGWASIGWPFTMASVLVYIAATIVITVTGTWATVSFVTAYGWAAVVWLWAAIPRTGYGALAAGALVGAPVAWLTWTANRLGVTWAAIQRGAWWGALTAIAVYTAWRLGGYTLAVMAVLTPVGVAIDSIAAQRLQAVRLVRRWAQWRRETPTVFAVIASQTRNIQSTQDGTVERNLTLAARLRPILEAPAMSLAPVAVDFEQGAVEHRVYATPGRTLDKLAEVLPVWSAQMPTIGDYIDAMTLHPDPGTDLKAATSAVLRVHFKLDAAGAGFESPWRLVGS